MILPIEDGRRRVVIEAVSPAVDDGRFPVKRTAGDQVRVEADIFTDGHDAIAASVLAHREGSEKSLEIPMRAIVNGNDRWAAPFRVTEVGRYSFTVHAWVDHFETWHRDLLKRIAAETDAAVDYMIGADLVAELADRAEGEDVRWLEERAGLLRYVTDLPKLRAYAVDLKLHELAARYPEKRFATESDREYDIADLNEEKHQEKRRPVEYSFASHEETMAVKFGANRHQAPEQSDHRVPLRLNSMIRSEHHFDARQDQKPRTAA